MNQAKLISMYISQGDHYFSDSKSDMIQVKDMHPAHAANAAAALLEDVKIWAADAGVKEANAKAWMLGSALFRALQGRATGGGEKEPFVCHYCDYRTCDVDLARNHAVTRAHWLTQRPS